MQININRKYGKVTFDEVSIDVTENVFFTNLDPEQAHWPYLNPNAASPDFCDNQIGAAPSANSSQCTVPTPKDLNPPNNKVTYKCKLHPNDPNEQGTINVFAQLVAGTTTLPQVSVNTPLPVPGPVVVVGGKSPYTISGQEFQVTDSAGTVIQSGSGIGPGLQLSATTNNKGISVTGTPTLVGTYQFTFKVHDAMRGYLQQVQYSMKVV